MVFIDDDDHEFLKGLSDVNRLNIFDAVNKLPKFPGYQPKSSSESFSNIVIKSVGLMHLLNIKKKLPAKEVEEFEDLITDVCVEVKHQEWIHKNRKCGARLPQTPRDGCDVHEMDGNPDKDAGGTPKYHHILEGDEKPDKSDAGTVTYGDILEGDGKPEEPVVNSQETSPSYSTLIGDVCKGDKSPSHFLCKNDNVIEMNKPFKHDALFDAVVGALENTEKTKVSLSPAAFSEDDSSHQVDYGNLIEQIKLDEEEKKILNKLLKRKVVKWRQNKDTEVNKDQEEKEGTLNKRDVLVGGDSTHDNSMEGYSKNAVVENSEGKNKADVRD